MSTLIVAAALSLSACAGMDAWTQGVHADDLDSGAPSGSNASVLQFDGAPPRNVLMISMDTFQAARLGRYYGGDHTAFLDTLLEDGVALDNHRSCSNWTYSSVLCVLSGQDNIESGFVPYAASGQEGTPQQTMAPAPDEMAFLTDVLGDHGYVTGLVSSNTFLSKSLGLVSMDTHQVADGSMNAADVVDEGLAMFDEHMRDGEAPWFLQLHFIDPHDPYDPPDGFRAGLAELDPIGWDLADRDDLQELAASWDRLSARDRQLVQDHARVLYHGEIAYMDSEIEGLFRKLEVRGALDDTLVVLWSDHGEQFWEHGGVLHGDYLYLEENAAFAGFWAKEGLERLAWDRATTHRDIMPTLLDALGIEQPGMTGQVVGTEARDRARFALRYNSDTSMQAVEHDGYRMIYRWGRGDLELYDLVGDPGEQHDLVDAEPALAQELWALLEPQVRALDAMFPGESPTEPDL